MKYLIAHEVLVTIVTILLDFPSIGLIFMSSQYIP